MEATGILTGTSPRRGRGPAHLIVNIDGIPKELGTFDGAILRQAAGAIGSQVTVIYEEKPSKDGSKTYLNLTGLILQGGAIEGPVAPTGALQGPQEPPGTQDSGVPAIPPRVTAEIVPTSPLGALDAVGALEQSFALAARRYDLLQKFIKDHFVLGTHYVDGAMFGGKKPVLLQPGAHLIAQAYGLRLNPEVAAGPLEAPKDPNTHYTIVTKCTVSNHRGEPIGAAYGSASSLIWSGRQGAYVGRAADADKIHNSCVKMSVKRAVVAAVRQSTDAASLFAEDLEEGGYGEEPKGGAKGGKFIRRG